MTQPPKVFDYKKGSMMQKVFNPLAGAERLDNGALFYKLSDEELSKTLNNEAVLRREFERVISQDALEIEDDEAELNAVLLT